MSEKGTYSDPRCCTCEPKYIWDARYACFRPAEYYRPDHPLRKNPEGWREVDGVDLPPITWAENDEQPHRTSAEAKKAFAEAALNGDLFTATVTERLEGSYNRFADRIAEAINKRIPGPDLNNDVLRKARSE